ncbi:hypothetical protein MASR1M32_07930 [Rhodobacter sp.]
MITQMAREVAEIPAAARRFLDLSAAQLQEAGAALRQADPRIVLTVARGSSDHAATYLKYATELVAGLPVASIGPSIASIYRRPLSLAGGPASASRNRGKAPTSCRCCRRRGKGVP